MLDSVLTGFEPLFPLLTVGVFSEIDVIASRQRARQIAMLCGFGTQEQTRISTAVSELARNAYAYANGGTVRFYLGSLERRQALVVSFIDRGPGIATLDAILACEPDALAGGGIVAARRFMDRCFIDTGADGTRIALAKAFQDTDRRITGPEISAAIGRLEPLRGNFALSEAHQQNRELTDALAALQAKQAELLEVSERLHQTNQQVEALNGQLKEKAESLVSADRRKDEFLSVLSHELRSPLSAASMAAHLLESGPGANAQSTRLGQVITRQVGHMSRLVEDLLDVSRISRGLVSIAKMPVDLRDVVGSAVEQSAPAAEAKRHVVDVVLPAVPCMVDGDRTRLTQVVGNLLGNAIRYTPEGGRIAVLVQVEPDALLVRVSDNGIGIPAVLMPHLFDLYTQAERSTDGRNSGLGLGLALVKSLVEAHGGAVSCRSAGAGQGSCFEVRLKAAGLPHAAA